MAMEQGHQVVRVCPEGRLVFGLHLPIAAQSRAFAQGWEQACGAVEMRRIAEAAESAGLFYLGVSDHIAIPRPLAPAMSTVWYDAVATLGFLAAATSRIRLLSYVAVLPYRHPLASAKSYSTLDALSGGRLILGVGAGHAEAEFAALGVPFAERGARLDEAIDAVRAAFREEWPDHEGRFYKFRDLGLAPRPVQQLGPPIWVGGSTPAALRRAAERGDGWLPQGVPEMGMAAAIDLIRERRERLRGGAPIEIGMNAPWMFVGTPGFDLPEGTVSGSPERLAEPLRAARALGVNHVGVRFRSRSPDELIDQIHAFGSEVAPLV